jgi:hypothetical protein
VFLDAVVKKHRKWSKNSAAPQSGSFIRCDGVNDHVAADWHDPAPASPQRQPAALAREEGQRMKNPTAH